MYVRWREITEEDRPRCRSIRRPRLCFADAPVYNLLSACLDLRVGNTG